MHKEPHNTMTPRLGDLQALVSGSHPQDLEHIQELLKTAIDARLTMQGSGYEVREDLQKLQSLLRKSAREGGQVSFAPILQYIDDIATKLSRLTTTPASTSQE